MPVIRETDRIYVGSQVGSALYISGVHVWEPDELDARDRLAYYYAAMGLWPASFPPNRRDPYGLILPPLDNTAKPPGG